MSDKQYVNELHKIIEEGDTLLLDNYLEDNDSGFIISDFGQILNERVSVEKKFKSGDRVENIVKYPEDLKGTVIQSYLHLDGVYSAPPHVGYFIMSPHIRYVVEWDTGELKDLNENEIELIK